MGLHGDPDFAASHADEGSFLDVPRLGWLILDEQIPLPGPPRRVGDAEYAKAMIFLRRRADVEGTAFAEAVASHTNVALSLPGLVRFNWALPNARFYRERAIAPLFDASLEYCFDDLAALDAAFADPRALRENFAGFADLDAGESFRAIEERWFWPDR